MGFYSETIFPHLMDWFMDREVLAKYRKILLADARGHVLEIGFGTGVNLPYYPSGIPKITALDPNPGMQPLAQRRIKAAGIPVESRVLNAERLPMADNSFDTVVSTLTMCSIRHLPQALAELHRVLKPGGRLLFLEHGLSPDRSVQAWQHRLTPVSKFLGGGCHLDRNIKKFVEAQPFSALSVDNYYLEDAPKIAGYMYHGTAAKA
jgi:ubiquinone/menaquinone biosynthesis C-methylase UbiE